jgi:hypothetical protein
MSVGIEPTPPRDATTEMGSAGSIRRRRARGKRRSGFKDKVKALVERLYGQIEMVLMDGMVGIPNKRQEPIWTDARCPNMVNLFVNKQTYYSGMIMGVQSNH